MEDFISLKKFNTYEEASTVAEMLEKNSIEFTIAKEDGSQDENTVFAGNTYNSDLHIKVKSEDLERASELIKDLEEISVERLDKDYYLFTFSDDELIEILKNTDEWSYNDYLWAQEILKQRGKEISPSTLADWKQKRLEFLSQPSKISPKFLLTSYIFCFLGGIVGYFMGNYLVNSQKLLPNGQLILSFDEETRQKGMSIKKYSLISLLIGIIAIIILIYSLLQD
jgi:hypothetical protein